MFLTVETPIIPFKISMDEISLPELPCCSPRPASTALEGSLGTGVSCSSRWAPREAPPQAVAADACLVGAQWAAQGLCLQPATTQAISLQWWAAASKEPQLPRSADVRANLQFVLLG